MNHCPGCKCFDRETDKLKNFAHKIKKQMGCKHVEALDKAAFKFGYSNYDHFLRVQEAIRGNKDIEGNK